jgi:hypothetical protein
MTGRRIKLKGFKLSKAGKVEADQRRLNVSQRLKQKSRNSKRIRVARRRITP